MRIAKAIAHAGLCSRRDAERWIADGRVRVNGAVITSPALDVGPGRQGRRRRQGLAEGRAGTAVAISQAARSGDERTAIRRAARPCSRTCPRTCLASFPSAGSISIPRALLLLTTDGDLARHIELPATGWTRRYRVRAHGRVSQSELDKLKDGITIEGVRYGPIEATVDSMQGGNCWLSMALREGKNREVRNVLATLGLSVNRLIRVSFGPFQLLDLPAGEVEQVKRRILADQLGRELSERFGFGTSSEEAPHARAGTGRRRRGAKPDAKPKPKPKKK